MYKVIWGVISALLILTIAVPIGLEHLIFRNEVYSVLSNAEWAGFLGSFIGGIIGSLGTLLAVYFTTKETRKVQQENKIQFDANDKKIFADDIVKTIAIYITDISNYFYECKRIKLLNGDIEYWRQEIQKINNNLNLLYDKRKDLSITEKIQEHIIIESDIEKVKLLLEKNNLTLQLKEKECDSIKANRTIANECYFTLKLKLKNIECAKMLLSQLELIHSQSTDMCATEFDFIDKETKKLMDLTADFIKEYTK